MSDVMKCVEIHLRMEAVLNSRFLLKGRSKLQFHRLDHLPMIYFLPADRLQIHSDLIRKASDGDVVANMARAMANLAAYRQYEQTVASWTIARIPSQAVRPVRVLENSAKWTVYFNKLLEA